jgi:hypothetical protein
MTADFENVLRIVREAFRKRKGYASFWDFPDKQVKERGIVKDLLKSVELKEGVCHIRRLVSNPDKYAPVDCFGTDILGKTLAYEVTELVDEKTVRLNRRGVRVYKEWSSTELITKLTEKLLAKNDQLKAARYDKQIVVIFTDEPFLRHSWCVPILRHHAFGPLANINEAYLLFSYEPGREGCPYIVLNLDSFGSFAIN